MLNYLKTIPGVAWVTLITAIIGWLQGDWFADQPWVPIVVIVLSAIAQIIRVYVPVTETRSLDLGRSKQGKLSRILWGDKRD